MRPRFLVSLQHGERAIAVDLEDARRNDADGRAIARNLVLEDHELAEEFAPRVQRDEELPAVLVQQQHLDEALEHHEPMCGGITLVVDDLILLELPEGHMAGELSTIDLRQDLDREHIGERAGHLAKLFDLHGRESLGGPSSGPACAGGPAP